MHLLNESSITQTKTDEEEKNKRMFEATSTGSDLLFWSIACSDIHTTKYYGGHDIFVKIIKMLGVAGNFFQKHWWEKN